MTISQDAKKIYFTVKIIMQVAGETAALLSKKELMKN